MSTIKLLLIAAFTGALSWIVLIPIWQYPDEQAHFGQVQYIAEIGGIPEGGSVPNTSYEVALSEEILDTRRDENGNNDFTFHPEHKLQYSQNTYGPREKELADLPKSSRKDLVKTEATLNPPFYYDLASVVYRIFACCSLMTRVYAIRVFSAIVFTFTIFVAYKIGSHIFKSSPASAIVLAAMIGFMPMLTFASTGVLPDTLTNFLFSLFIFVSLKILGDFSIKKSLILFLVIFAGALTRQHFLIVLFLVPPTFLYIFLKEPSSRIRILGMSIACLVALYIAGFFISSLSFISRLDFPESSSKIANNPLAHISYVSHLGWTLNHSLREVWPWYWGIYKWLSLALPHPIYQIINRLIPVAILGLTIKIFLIFKSRSFKEDFWVFFLILVNLVYFMALTTFDYFFRKNNGYSFGIQGRYFFPPIIATFTLLLTGFKEIFKLVLRKYSDYGLFIIVIAFVIFNDFSLLHVSTSYYDTTNLSSFLNQASQYKPQIIKGNVIYVLSLALFAQLIFLFQFFKSINKLYNKQAQ